MHFRRLVVLSAFMLGLAGSSMGAVIVDKIPDQGGVWFPLNAEDGTFVYANSFIAPSSATVLSLGVYLLNDDGGTNPSEFRLQLWADDAGAPDPAAVLGTTDVLTFAGTDLTLITANLLAPVNITLGTQYWVAATTVGLSGSDSYQLGGHTQNSIYTDNGTFWYSNDPAGLDFDGEALEPEMAIWVSGDLVAAAVPEPSTWSALALGLVALGYRKFKK